MIDPGVQIKAVERNALSTNRDLCQMRTDLRIEAIAVHAEVTRGVAES